jgi:hypothetical protein
LVGAKVVDVEDELVGEVFLAPPDHPSDTGADEAVLVPANIPLQLREQERSDVDGSSGGARNRNAERAN